MKIKYVTFLCVILLSTIFFIGCFDNGGVYTIDIRLPSKSAGDNGTLAVRIISPLSGNERYDNGAPIIIYMQGGYEIKGIGNNLPLSADDIVIVTFIYPGGTDPWSNLSSDGDYDYRGTNCIEALRDVILFSAGKITDNQGQRINELVPAEIRNENIGLIGLSNGGNIIVAASAHYGNMFDEHLQYVIQWETPVNSQIGCRDLGRVILDWTTMQTGDYENPYYLDFNSPNLDVDYSNLEYKAGFDMFQIFHDGNGDGEYTTILNDQGIRTPDLNNNNVIDEGEDFPLSNYTDGSKFFYSRAVTYNLSFYQVFNEKWPSHIANVSEATSYWNLRESVVMFDDVIGKNPDLEVMILGSVDDHVQIEKTKPHLRLAFEGWKNANSSWVQINPDKSYLIEVDPRLANHNGLPDTSPNQPPQDWLDHTSYCYPENIYDGVVELAAIYEMADRNQG